MNHDQKLIITGPTTLSGTIEVQGSKNAAMKHVLMPLLSPGLWTLRNIPRIGSIDNLLKITELHNIKVNWISKNAVAIDSTDLVQSTVIPAELFYYTSGAIFILNILSHRFGSCSLEKHNDRKDTGGDQIGSRELAMVCKTFDQLGIETSETETTFEFKLKSHDAFVIDVPVRSFSVSVNAVIAALFKDGISVIKKPTGEADFYDTIRLLQKAGAIIEIAEDVIRVQGPARIQPTEFSNMYDRHDFVTILAAALTTNSSITISNVDYTQMRLDALTRITEQMNIKLSFENNHCYVPAQLNTINPITIHAGLYPMFITEWQVLFAPLLSQVKGTSEVVETLFSNRMQHYKELSKLGVKYAFFAHPDYAEKDGCPRAVKVFGQARLTAAEVHALDVRCGGALIIAALGAKGQSIIYNYDHIARGYDDIVERFQNLGADIFLNHNY